MEIDELKQDLPDISRDSWHHLEKDPQTGKISGFVVSEKFQGQTDRERQQDFWAYLQRMLQQKAKNVGTILLYTPEEFEAMTAVEEAG